MTMEKIYRVQMNKNGAPNFATAEEVADRPKGEWIEHKREEHDEELMMSFPMHNYECSKCGYTLNAFEPTNFCPNCGSDNRGEDNE